MSPERIEGPHSVLKWPMHQPVEVFEMPKGSVVIEVATQDGVPTLWTLSPSGPPSEARTFVGFGTGHPIWEQKPLEFVGTAHDVHGAGLVFHLFERIG